MENLFDGFLDEELFAEINKELLVRVSTGVKLTTKFLLFGVVAVVVIPVETKVGCDHVIHLALAGLEQFVENIHLPWRVKFNIFVFLIIKYNTMCKVK